MTIILRDVVRLDRLISDISRASRLDNEMATESARRIDLRDLVESFVTARQATTETHKLRFVAGDNEVPVMVQDGRIVQILDNLLGNAVSFAPAGTSVDFTVSLADDGSACLEVCDQGPGIPEGRLNEVFNRFYSERPEGEAFGEHSGLGLSIAQQIAQGYGGDLVASNRDGACFTLTLPRTEI